jgi:hypothetical protein
MWEAEEVEVGISFRNFESGKILWYTIFRLGRGE